MQAGVEAHKQGKFDVAIQEFRKATESDPNLPEAFLDLGEVLQETHDYPAAIAALKHALELKPDLDPAHLQLGYALLQQGYAEEAIPHLERVRRQSSRRGSLSCLRGPRGSFTAVYIRCQFTPSSYL